MMKQWEFIVALHLIIFSSVCVGWREWLYETRWSTDEVALPTKVRTWQEVWTTEPPPESVNDRDPLGTGAPRPRTGHSMVLTEYYGSTYILLFGGRDNNKLKAHVPKTYNVQKQGGTMTFTTYDEKPVNPCNDYNNTYYTPLQQKQAGCKLIEVHNEVKTDFNYYSQVQVGVFYNDVWAYRLCDVKKPTDPPEKLGRYFDTQCEGEGWLNWHSGALEGGCQFELGTLVCNTPSERYEHTAVMFKDSLMYVYGGYSQRCADFCDDMWAFDIFVKAWKQVYPAGQLSKLYFEYTTTTVSGKLFYNPADVPVDNSTKKWAGPGERWRSVMVIGPAYNSTRNITTDATMRQDFAVFGGHRLWHGYALENEQNNNWDNFDTRKPGGYLDDLWIYSKELDFTTIEGSTFKKSVGSWRKVRPKQFCFASPGESWDSRNDRSCKIVWPLGRAGHGGAWDSKRNLLWIFGGYNTYFPYLRTDGPGSGPGITALNVGGFVPYPGYNYFLNDLWYYNMSDGYWTEITFPVTMDVPAPRAGHIFILLGDVIFLHGGYADNNYFDDTWYYNITSTRWLIKKKYVYPKYPASCTSDVDFVKNNPKCQHMMWPKHLERDVVYPFDVLPYYRQQYYWPDPTNGPYWNILKKVDNPEVEYRKKILYSSHPPVGTPEFPYAASGPIQYAQKFFYSFNSTHNATLVASCTSVFGEPTRGHPVDGKFGRSKGSVFIPQLRTRNPGWDGCRDRADGRTDLVQELQYVKPFARAGHRAIFYAISNEIIMYGGTGYVEEQPSSIRTTWPTRSLDDMWYFNLFHCINNCSLHGDCYYGFCVCYVGYYGEDCSNTSCPGTFCHYDPITFDDICVHACQAGYKHTDNDVYVPDIAKLPCTVENPGESNGVCDGFGKTQCAPPFIGDDCGTKDCKSNCSFHGWCSIEFPVSRCMCQPGYFGEICEKQVCLNNCSYPNGVCNTTSGDCICRPMYNPYNNSMYYHEWEGEDCSFLWAYSGAVKQYGYSIYLLVMVLLSFAVVVIDSYPNLALRDDSTGI